MHQAETPLLHMRGISKSFPGVQALADVDLTLGGGEVLAVVGENGAGKSTLIKILAGVHRPDTGQITLRPSLPAGVGGKPKPDSSDLAIRSPLDARRAGIGVIYQELNLVPTLDAVANVFLGKEGSTWLQQREERQRARTLFARFGVDLPLGVPCRRLTIAQQQIVEIVKSLVGEIRVLVLDEPSAPLTPKEVQRLFAILHELKSQGIGIIYISHRLDEVFQVADRIMVLRDGRHVATRARTAVTRSELIELMVGRRLDQEFPPRTPQPGPVRLAVRNLSRGAKVRGVSFEVRQGEIVALTGLVGSGRTEVARLLAGADHPEAGAIELDGRELRLNQPRDAIAAGICLLTEDRKAQGLVLGRSVLENFALPNLDRWSRWGWLRLGAERRAFDQHAAGLRIRTARPSQAVRNLSGGNQQKVILARWLEADCKLLIFDEPTRGIDVGAKYEIYLLMNKLVQQGKAILMVSSELPEVLGMADRILVLHQGHIAGELRSPRETTQEQIMRLATGSREYEDRSDSSGT